MTDMKASRQIILVVGKKGAGKTAYLEYLSQLLRKKGAKVGGFLCLNELKGSKDDYHLLNLKNNQSWKLASRHLRDQHTVQYGDYNFNPKVFDIGNKILEQSLTCAAIIVDEYGPLERKRTGFYSGIKFLLETYSGILIIASRPATLNSLKKLIYSQLNLNISD
jgi:nucleoside-triphosphatase THEP1